MCLVVPLKIKLKMKDGRLMMENGRVVKLVLTERVKLGDYLVCQHDLAVEKISEKQALAMRRAIKGVSDEIQTRN